MRARFSSIAAVFALVVGCEHEPSATPPDPAAGSSGVTAASSGSGGDGPGPTSDAATTGSGADPSTGGTGDGITGSTADEDSGGTSGGVPQGGGNVGWCDGGGPARSNALALTDLTGTYQGLSGCLYPGSNQHPLPHPEVTPVGGLIGVGSIGMSNGAQEFTYFLNEVATPPPGVVMFNGAQGGQTSDNWADPDAPVWNNFAQAMTQVGLAPDQLRAVWVKSALTQSSNATLMQAAQAEQQALQQVLTVLAQKYPSVQIAYLTSRAYGGYGCGLSPEPAAHGHGFAIKWLIEEQIEGQHAQLPFLAWGPYIWADGATPRSDGHAWLPEDFGDGCHPNIAGRAKVGALMQQFLLEEAPWYAP